MTCIMVLLTQQCNAHRGAQHIKISSLKLTLVLCITLLHTHLLTNSMRMILLPCPPLEKYQQMPTRILLLRWYPDKDRRQFSGFVSNMHPTNSKVIPVKWESIFLSFSIRETKCKMQYITCVMLRK